MLCCFFLDPRFLTYHVVGFAGMDSLLLTGGLGSYMQLSTVILDPRTTGSQQVYYNALKLGWMELRAESL
jgi:hypothetical protein